MNTDRDVAECVCSFGVAVASGLFLIWFDRRRRARRRALA